MTRKALGCLLFAAAAVLSGPSQSALLFSDNFDADAGASVLNFNSLINWTISNGTIDYIRNGGFGISCFGGTGGCLDMDGSTSDAGRITSKSTFTILPGVVYTLEFEVSGNQRGAPPDTISWGLVNASTNAPLVTISMGSIASGFPFTLEGTSFTSGSPFTVRLFFEGSGGDNFGTILDNVVFRDNTTGTAVPEPGTLALLGLGLAGLAATRRRKQ